MDNNTIAVVTFVVGIALASFALVAGVLRDDGHDGARIVLAIALIGLIVVASACLGSVA